MIEKIKMITINEDAAHTKTYFCEQSCVTILFHQPDTKATHLNILISSECTNLTLLSPASSSSPPPSAGVSPASHAPADPSSPAAHVPSCPGKGKQSTSVQNKGLRE